MGSGPETVHLHGETWDWTAVSPQVEWATGRAWHPSEWNCRDALVEGSMDTPYVGQSYDPEKAEVVRGGWDHDHCQICFWTLRETEDAESGAGYTDGDLWLCTECYEKLVSPRQRGQAHA